MASSQHSTFTEKRPVWSVSGEGRLTANAIAFLLLILEGGGKICVIHDQTQQYSNGPQGRVLYLIRSPLALSTKIQRIILFMCEF